MGSWAFRFVFVQRNRVEIGSWRASGWPGTLPLLVLCPTSVNTHKKISNGQILWVKSLLEYRLNINWDQSTETQYILLHVLVTQANWPFCCSPASPFLCTETPAVLTKQNWREALKSRLSHPWQSTGRPSSQTETCWTSHIQGPHFIRGLRLASKIFHFLSFEKEIHEN